ncbi:MAG: DUF615 domain-containing protein [Desulfobulbaceae bacterium]|nr:DUF615 domain-containing protein [Desulfobulbaceae bacterium]
MDYAPSRSEKKRQAKDIEKLSQELVELPPADIAKLPCEEFLRQEIIACRDFQGGARKRQIKYVAKELRQVDVTPMLAFLESRRGSHLKGQLAEKELERHRLNILDAAICEYQDRLDHAVHFHMDPESSPLLQAKQAFPDFDIAAATRAAEDFAATRRPVHSRQLLRLLHAAAERRKFSSEEK